MAKSEQEQELSDFLANFYIDDEMMGLMEIMAKPISSDPNAVVAISPEQVRALAQYKSRAVNYVKDYLAWLEEDNKSSNYSSDELLAALYKHLNNFRKK